MPWLPNGEPSPNPHHRSNDDNMKTGTQLIAEERQRQISQEGWTPEHDDTHQGEELSRAACAYAFPNAGVARTQNGVVLMVTRDFFWPWEPQEFKPSATLDRVLQSREERVNGRVRELVKAGALIAAEIDRLQRAQHPTPEAAR